MFELFDLELISIDPKRFLPAPLSDGMPDTSARKVANFMHTPYGLAVVTLLAAGLVLVNVLLHYEVLNLLSTVLDRLTWVGRPRIVLLICALLLVHIVEIWIFAGGIMIAGWHGGLGDLKGDHKLEVLDYVYFSSMTYTTVGYGDLFPSGPLRFIAAMEALLGLMLITWSASFTYLELQRFGSGRQTKAAALREDGEL